MKHARGTDPGRVPMHRFVVCVQNHDQIGNRALGERLHHEIDAARWRAASVLLLTVPMTPLLFMGQEWAASSPFQYFTDLSPDLGRLVTEGRRKEFADFPAFSNEEARERIPDPQAEGTFLASTAALGRAGERRPRALLRACTGRCWRCDASIRRSPAATRRPARRLLRMTAASSCAVPSGPTVSLSSSRFETGGVVDLETGALYRRARHGARGVRRRSGRDRHRRCVHPVPAARRRHPAGVMNTPSRPSYVPTSTYRLQVHREFPLTAAADIVDYLSRLGIGVCYTSPYFTAAAGSTHGYDVSNHNEINPELGGDAAHRQFVEALKRHGVGHIVDFVPNHMGIGAGGNAWWTDVLENGPSSPTAKFFDIDWDAAQGGAAREAAAADPRRPVRPGARARRTEAGVPRGQPAASILRAPAADQPAAGARGSTAWPSSR